MFLQASLIAFVEALFVALVIHFCPEFVRCSDRGFIYLLLAFVGICLAKVLIYSLFYLFLNAMAAKQANSTKNVSQKPFKLLTDLWKSSENALFFVLSIMLTAHFCSTEVGYGSKTSLLLLALVIGLFEYLVTIRLPLHTVKHG